jgi:hypothetical protein
MKTKMRTKVCTKCGPEYGPKPIKDFGKLGKGLNPRCKKCVNEYQKSLRSITKYNAERSQEQIGAPIFEDKQIKGKQKVQRTQVVMLLGEVDKFIKIYCQCGLGIELEYQYSFDQKNDYYEAVCSVCGKTFKLNILNK